MTSHNVYYVKLYIEKGNPGSNTRYQSQAFCLAKDLNTRGELGFFGKAWQGFKILPDCILSPEGEHIWAYEVRALKYVYVAAGLERRFAER
jgi:hypothetical protein